MTIYKLFEYSLTYDEELVRESESLSDIIEFALNESYRDPEYTYRLETWRDYKQQYGFRFFNYGREITDKIRKAILGSIVEVKY